MKKMPQMPFKLVLFCGYPDFIYFLGAHVSVSSRRMSSKCREKSVITSTRRHKRRVLPVYIETREWRCHSARRRVARPLNINVRKNWRGRSPEVRQGNEYAPGVIVVRPLICAIGLISQSSPAARSRLNIFPNGPITASTTIHICATRGNMSLDRKQFKRRNSDGIFIVPSSFSVQRINAGALSLFSIRARSGK